MSQHDIDVIPCIWGVGNIIHGKRFRTYDAILSTVYSLNKVLSATNSSSRRFLLILSDFGNRFLPFLLTQRTLADFEPSFDEVSGGPVISILV